MVKRTLFSIRYQCFSLIALSSKDIVLYLQILMIAQQTRVRMEERASTGRLRTTALVEQGLLVPTVTTVRILIFGSVVFFLLFLTFFSIIWRVFKE